jgi:hypothetical protein
MERREFRQPSCLIVIGGALALVGGVISGVAAYHSATGIPLMQASSKVNGGEHVASGAELWLGILGGLPFLILGLALILTSINTGVAIDEQGITATNLLHRTTFAATWPEVTRLERMDPGPGSGYSVVARGKTLALQTSAANMNELVEEIKRLAPNLTVVDAER